MTLMTNTRVVTARMTPSSVRKLRSLWARKASKASFRVSKKVIQPLFRLSRRDLDSSVRPPIRGTPASLSMGVTPKMNSRFFKDDRSVEIVPYLDVLEGYLLSPEPAIL